MEEIKVHQFREKLELLGYSKRTVKDYPDYLRLFFKYLEKEEDICQVSDILPEHITGYHAYLQYNKLNRNNTWLSSVTIRSRLQTVKTFYQVMHQERLIEHDYAPLIIMPKSKRGLPKHVPSEKDMQMLLDSIKPVNVMTTRDRAILELLYATGVRNRELRELRVENLDFDEKTLFVNGKGSKDRVVPVGDWVLPYLREYLEAVRPKLINPRMPEEWLFLSKNGRIITNGNMGDLIRKYTTRAGIDSPITPHSFRHACATHLLKGGADIRYVQELLGHADLSATQIYTKIDISFLKQAHKRFHPREKQEPDGS